MKHALPPTSKPNWPDSGRARRGYPLGCFIRGLGHDCIVVSLARLANFRKQSRINDPIPQYRETRAHGSVRLPRSSMGGFAAAPSADQRCFVFSVRRIQRTTRFMTTGPLPLVSHSNPSIVRVLLPEVGPLVEPSARKPINTPAAKPTKRIVHLLFILLIDTANGAFVSAKFLGRLPTQAQRLGPRDATFATVAKLRITADQCFLVLRQRAVILDTNAEESEFFRLFLN